MCVCASILYEKEAEQSTYTEIEPELRNGRKKKGCKEIKEHHVPIYSA